MGTNYLDMHNGCSGFRGWAKLGYSDLRSDMLVLMTRDVAELRASGRQVCGWLTLASAAGLPYNLSSCGSPVDMRTVHNVHMITAEERYVHKRLTLRI